MNHKDPVAIALLSAMWALILAPVVAQGLWRPLTTVFGLSGTAPLVTAGALAVGLLTVVLRRLLGPERPRRVLAGGAALALLIGLVGGLPVVMALLGAAAMAGGLVSWLPARLPEELSAVLSRRRGLAVLAVLLGLFGVVQTARVATFMGDHTLVQHQGVPFVPFYGEHSCLTAYTHGLELADEGVDNLYAEEWWPALGDGEIDPAVVAHYAPFEVDTYAYPPPFLLLPKVALLGLSDFPAQRALWFALSALLVVFGAWRVVDWLEPRERVLPLLAAPLVLVSFPGLVTLQVGNVHLVVTVLAVLAMVAFDRGRLALGGGLLAVAILGKISPGILGVVLLAQGRFRAAAWTAAWGLVLGVATAAIFGTGPLEAFFTWQLPRLNSGAALSFFTGRAADVAANLSPFGLPFKLGLLGVAFEDLWAAGKAVNTVYTALILAVAVVVARRGGGRRQQLCVWLALLTLGALRSPFGPPYVVFAALWMLTLMAGEARRWWQVVVFFGALLVLQGTPTTPGMGPGVLVALGGVVQLVLFGLVGLVLLRRQVPYIP